MSLSLILYLSSVFSGVIGLCYFITLIYSIAFLITFFIRVTSYYEDDVRKYSFLLKKIIKKIWIPILCLTVSILLPDEKTMYMIIGSNYLSKSDIPEKVNEVINLKLEDMIKSFKDKK